ncbi:MAG: DUF4912 domain-containing protein [Gemmataceae bacterium]|nr:DUF4912 domain-containing protein [Gemmataceae bacterium]
MSTAGPLNDRPKKDLADLARKKGVRGWDGMTKDQLVRALNRLSKSAARPSVKAVPVPTRPAAKSAAKVTKPAKPAPTANGSHKPAAGPRLADLPAPKPAAPAKPAVAPPAPAPVAAPKPVSKAAIPAAAPIPADKDISSPRTGATSPTKDRVFLMVPDPYWLHVTWELTQQSVQRAEAALRQDWHGAKPVIRLFDVTSQDTTSTSETPVRDVVIHGGCTNWYIDVPQPPRTYRADIGYLSRRGELFVLARSNVVTPPKAGAHETLDVGVGDLDKKQAERILAMSGGFETPAANPELKELFEERLRRPLGTPKEMAFGPGASLPGTLKKFHFQLDAHLVVNGRTDPAAHVTLGNEPVKLRSDGTFTMLFSLPDSRQIIPAVATSGDGSEERTIVLAVERNTKHLDPMIHDQMAEG